jgi:hypothetical protein
MDPVLSFIRADQKRRAALLHDSRFQSRPPLALNCQNLVVA